MNFPPGFKLPNSNTKLVILDYQLSGWERLLHYNCFIYLCGEVRAN